MAGLKRDQLEKWMGQVGFVAPGPKSAHQEARIAVKVIGVNYGYGRWLFRVQPLAGTGSWQVAVDAVEFKGDA